MFLLLNSDTELLLYLIDILREVAERSLWRFPNSAVWKHRCDMGSPANDGSDIGTQSWLLLRHVHGEEGCRRSS